MKIKETLTDEGKIIVDLTNLFINKNKEIEKLTAESTEWESKCYHYQDILNELEKEIENRLMTIPDDVCDDEVKEIKRTTKIAVYQVILGKLQELKGDSSN